MSLRQTNFLKEMSWKQFEERKKDTDLVIIPTGAFEVYGPHLPLGSDTLVATKIAEMVADNCHAIIGPTLEVGDSALLDDFPGTITITPESFKAYLNDVINSLKKWGFKDFFFINSHVGNVPIIGQLAIELERDEDIRCAQIDYWRFIQHVDKGIVESGAMAHRHASEAGTSVLLYLYPDLVDTNRWVNEPPQFSNPYPDIIQYHRYGTRSVSGTIGDATLGTKEKGELLVKRTVERINQFLSESWGYSEKS